MSTRTFQLLPAGWVQHYPSDPSSLDAVTRQLASGLYTTFRTHDRRRRVLGLRAHLRRLFGPARELGIQPQVSPEQARRSLSALLEAHAVDFPDEVRLRLVLEHAGQVFAVLEPLAPLPPEVYRQGVRLITLELHRERPHLKSTAFIESSQAQRQRIAAAGAFEALMVQRGRILEGVTSNFFYVKNGVLGTASRGVLPGVTRQTVLRLARRAGLGLVYRPLALDQLPALSEAFITSSSRGLVPVIQVDDIQIGDGHPGPVTTALAQNYDQLVLRRAERIQPD